MAMDFVQSKKKLSGVNSLLKQGKLLAAVTGLQEGLEFFLRTSLLKHEKEELCEQIEWAVYQLGSDRGFKQVYPLKIAYSQGEERALLETVREILRLLDEEATKEAQGQAELMALRIQERLDQGQEFLDGGKIDEARAWFDKLCREFDHNPDLKADVGDRFLKAGLHDDAIRYLKSAFKDDPKSAHVFNKLAIALRKAGRFDEAERFFQLALKTSLRDEFLYFNLGRVYLDWKRWEQAKEAADQALALNPGFDEAAKMKAYAERMMNG
ncbi:MAG: tetratricopeptide repeat protein [Deltaproteobacteria bacterium]|nr:tetratricopeptide repeat protein [Deltaproteobacteria bacterium]